MKTEISAPIDGVVSSLQVREGEMVVIGIQNQPGTTLMTVSDLTAIDAEIKVAEADVLRLKVGQPATVTLEAITGRRFDGRVVEIGASALPVVGTTAAAREFRVVVRLDRPDASLRPGLTCDAEILTDEKANATTVPLQAVVIRPGAGPGAQDTSGVFVVEGDVARFKPVKTGIIGGLEIEVSGLSEGTTVVTGPYQALRDLTDGGRIRTRE
jgi:HlyD family secretion protein